MQEKRQISHALSNSLYKIGYEAMPLLLKFDHHYSMFHMEKKKKKRRLILNLLKSVKTKLSVSFSSYRVKPCILILQGFKCLLLNPLTSHKQNHW